MFSPARRRLLRAVGLAAAASYPGFRPGRVHADSQAHRKYFVAIPYFYGVSPAHFWPKATAPDVALDSVGELPPILRPLENFRADMLVLRGLRLAASDGTSPHIAGNVTMLSGSSPDASGGSYFNGTGPTIDQEIARTMQAGMFPSVEQGLFTYGRPTVWRGRGNHLPAVENPNITFDRLFADVAPGVNAVERAALRAQSQSMLDHVSKEIVALSGALGNQDRIRLDAHLTSIRAIERRLSWPLSQGSCPVPVKLPDLKDWLYYQNPGDIAGALKLQMDIIVAAFACDITRVATLQLGSASKNPIFPFLGFSEGLHPLSHVVAPREGSLDKYVRALTWYHEQFAYLATQLKGTPHAEGGSLFDASAIFVTSEIGVGWSHTINDLPILVLGNAGGYFRTGRLMNFGNQRAHNDLLVSLANAYGSPAMTFGTPKHCKGPLPIARG